MSEQPKPKCPQCGKPIETAHDRKIIYRARDPITRRQCVKEAVMQFCSPQCGGHYQMGCEG